MFQDVRINQNNGKKWVDNDKQKEAKSKFMQFVESVDALDEEVKKESTPAASEEMGFDADNLSIGFQTSQEPDGGRTAASMIFGMDDEESPFAKQPVMEQDAHEELVTLAKEKYNRFFFNKFTFSGKNSQLMT